MRRALVVGAALTGLIALPGEALAHDAFGNAGAFWGGVLHPLTALEHALAIVAFGLLAGQQSQEAAFVALIGLALGLGLGATLGVAHLLAGGPGLLAAGTIAPLGVLIALALPLPRALLVALAVALGLIHGIANGEAIAPGLDPVAFVAGIMVGPTLVVHLVSGAVHRLQRPWTRVAVRVLGSWLAAVGLLVLGRFALAPTGGGA